jgi:hypothetical protein
MILNILLILSLAGLVFAFLQLRKSPETFQPIAYGLVVIVLVLVGVRMFRSCGGSRPEAQIEPDFYSAATYKIGQEIAKQVPGGGELVVLHAGTFNDVMKKILAAQLDGLKKGLGGANFTIVESGPRATTEDEMMMLSEPYIPLQTFAKYAQERPNATAMLSLIGTPMLDAQAAAPKLPPLFVIGMVDPEQTKPLFARGVVKAAVFYKVNADWKAKPSRGASLDDVFNLRYELVTAPPR